MKDRTLPRTGRIAAGYLIAGAVATMLATSCLTANAAAMNAMDNAGHKTMTQSVKRNKAWAGSETEKLAKSSEGFLLDHINTAEDYIDAGDYQLADQSLDRAMDTAGAIKAMLPFVVVPDQIREARNRLLGEGPEYMQDDMKSIFVRIDEMSLYAPNVALKAKILLSDAQEAANAGKKMAAVKGLDRAVAAITATSVYMPVDYVYAQVDAAHWDLNKPGHDVAEAKQALAKARQRLLPQVAGDGEHKQS
jgi:hypothetical protein